MACPEAEPGAGSQDGQEGWQSRHCDWPRCCYVTSGHLMPFLHFVSSNQCVSVSEIRRGQDWGQDWGHDFG